MEKAPLDIAWVVISAGFVFLMQAGFMCLESGLTRSKNNINVSIKNIMDFGISVLLFWAFGFALMFGATEGGLFGSTNFFVSVTESAGPWLATFFLFQAMFVGTATTIVSGAVAERMRFRAYLLFAAILSGLIYPLFGHWAWGGAMNGEYVGWLGKLGFRDFAGSSVVHSVGGWVALAVVIVIGPRAGRFPADGPPVKIPASNVPLAILGTLILWFGWLQWRQHARDERSSTARDCEHRIVWRGGVDHGDGRGRKGAWTRGSASRHEWRAGGAGRHYGEL